MVIVGGCGFWFLLYFLITAWLCMTMDLTNTWLVVGISIVVMVLIHFLKAVLVEAFQGQGGIAWVFRVGFLILLCILLEAGSAGWAIVLFLIFLLLELVVAFS
jgi:hypothetical protein